MTEDAIVGKLRRYAPLIGDDCAIVPANAREDFLFTTDFSIEGVHFARECAADFVGRRALVRGLSDIAAMGGTPRYCLVSLALAAWADQSWVDKFYRGLLGAAREYGAQLAGGDLSHAGQVVCDVMTCGSVRKGQALRRDGAQTGDAIYVSGPLGGWRFKPMPEPRLETGRKLLGKATSCMDISDGLALDLGRLCAASKAAAALDDVPLLPGATLADALHDGEDYELLFTAPASKRVPGIRIGAITAGQPGAITYRGRRIHKVGYDHFRNRS